MQLDQQHQPTAAEIVLRNFIVSHGELVLLQHSSSHSKLHFIELPLLHKYIAKAHLQRIKLAQPSINTSKNIINNNHS